MKTLFVLCSFICSTVLTKPIHSFNSSTSNIINTQYVQNGFVNYEALHQNLSIFEPAIQYMAAVQLKELSLNEKTAFLLNAYNLLVIKTIAENYPITSPLEIEGFFDKKTFKINARELTLDEIEHKVYYLSKNPLIHFGLVCAAKGCPLLNSDLFTPNKVGQQLENKAIEMFDNPDFLIEDKSNNSLKLSFIFKWNANHFPKDLVYFINKYKTIKVSEYATIEYYNYDWGLNEKK